MAKKITKNLFLSYQHLIVIDPSEWYEIEKDAND